ncbi:hypothetical protein Tsp_02787 [Trichinella spiralis]|uniref:hypothetical protein n=1 Tax=Trichinella spiralis TaxID=6334 RepID=UPI0001EFC582|nr:hypothetical protein Tsp_02787 [Trichinella spiralis]
MKISLFYQGQYYIHSQPFKISPHDAAEKQVRTYKLCAEAIDNSNNSHDLNTAYTCDRYQQVQFLINTNDSASDFNIQAMCFKFLNLNFFSMIVNGRVIWRMIEDDITFKKRKQQHIPPKMQNVLNYWKRLKKSSNSSIFIYPVAELFSYAHDLTTKRRNCGSRFLVPGTPCIWYSNRWKCSLFERMIGKKILNLKNGFQMNRQSSRLKLQKPSRKHACYRQYKICKINKIAGMVSKEEQVFDCHKN